MHLAGLAEATATIGLVNVAMLISNSKCMLKQMHAVMQRRLAM